MRILTLVYEYSYQGEEETAWEQLILCEQLIADEKDKDVQTYSQLSGALTHIFQATRTHLLHRAGKTTEAKQVQYSFPATLFIVMFNPCAGLAILGDHNMFCIVTDQIYSGIHSPVMSHGHAASGLLVSHFFERQPPPAWDSYLTRPPGACLPAW